MWINSNYLWLLFSRWSIWSNSISYSYTADNADDANKALFTLNVTLIELTNQISNLYFGLPIDKMFMFLDRRAYLGLTPAYLKVIC
ncbi:hypothetical protein [Spiroplasma endosymbiont of Polydrusus formosus]|uniref:hypothetical protein n=1 Tax=Spiroplasma endosymbiont of Polydrusus formosus TaxID=3139326 RepID=UPI0035B51D60